MGHLHAAKTAFVAVGDHASNLGRFVAGDIVIVDEPELVDLLVREGSLDRSVTVDAGAFTREVESHAADATHTADASHAEAREDAANLPKRGRGRKAAAAGKNRMVTLEEAQVRAEDEPAEGSAGAEPAEGEALPEVETS